MVDFSRDANYNLGIDMGNIRSHISCVTERSAKLDDEHAVEPNRSPH